MDRSREISEEFVATLEKEEDHDFDQEAVTWDQKLDIFRVRSVRIGYGLNARPCGPPVPGRVAGIVHITSLLPPFIIGGLGGEGGRVSSQLCKNVFGTWRKAQFPAN